MLAVAVDVVVYEPNEENRDALWDGLFTSFGRDDDGVSICLLRILSTWGVMLSWYRSNSRLRSSVSVNSKGAEHPHSVWACIDDDCSCHEKLTASSLNVGTNVDCAIFSV